MSPPRSARRHGVQAALSVLLCCWTITLAPAANAVGPEPVTVGPASEWELEDMRPGMSFRELRARFRLQDLVPMHRAPETRYVLDRTRPLPRPAAQELEERGIAGLELVFRDDRLTSVRVAYAGREDLLFAHMGEELRARYGQPASVVARGPLQVGRAHGVRLYLWLRVWTWKRDGLELVVEGKHYGVDKVDETPESHKYAFVLRQAGGDG